MSQTPIYRLTAVFAVMITAALTAAMLRPSELITGYLNANPAIRSLHLDDAFLGLMAAVILLLISERHQARRLHRTGIRLSQQRNRHAQLLDRMPYAIAELDSQLNIHHCNNGLQTLIDQLGRPAIEQQIAALRQQYDSPNQQQPAHLEHWYTDNSGTPRGIEWQLYRKDHSDFLTGRDITSRLAEQNKLTIADRILENTPIGVLVTDTSKRIQYINPAFEHVTGYDSQEVLGRSPAMLSSGKQGPDFYHEMYRILEQDGYWQGEIWNRKRNGDIYLEWLSITSLKDDHGKATHYIGMFSEFTAQERVKEKLRTLAYYDGLTSLANRALFNDQLKRLISLPRDKQLCVIFIDIDGFKRINDSLGHQVGDQLLVAIARRLKEHSRDQDIIARWGGDEFIMAIEVSDSHQGIEQFCNKHLYQLKQPFFIGGRELSITASMGASIHGDDARGTTELIRNADIAMFQSKKRGKNRFEIFSPAHHEELMESMEIENRLRIAIKEQQIDIHFQPQIRQPGAVIFGLEALARWHDPLIGPVPPQKFIRIAEETGLIHELSVLIFQTALKRFKVLQQLNPEIMLSVNLSATQLQESYLPDTLKQITGDLDIDPARIKLEITEDVLMSDIERSISNTSQLKELGFQISLDDFGIGYSSLSYLKDLDIDEIKIDRSFVNDLNNSERNQAIIQAIIAMSQVLNIDCIVEGVETEAQLEELAQMGCNNFQGFLFHKPMPEASIQPLLSGAGKVKNLNN